MSPGTGIVILGMLILVLPFLGFPETWRELFFVLAGGALVVIGFLVRSGRYTRGSSSRRYSHGSSFVENADHAVGDDVRTKSTTDGMQSPA